MIAIREIVHKTPSQCQVLSAECENSHNEELSQMRIIDTQPPNERVQSVAFVLPCLNEAKTIEWCVDRAQLALKKLHELHALDGEIIVADNGSTDGSQAFAKAAGARVVSVAERGYGAALQGGFNASEADYFVMGDSDCSYDFVEGVEMVERLIEGADFCMGSRFKGEILPGAMPWKNRYIGNPILSGMLRLLFRTKISDSHCGLRAIRREAYLELNPTSTGMEFASEMVLKAVLHDLRIDEVPITLSPDQRERPPHLNPWSDGLRHLIYMLLLSPKHLFMWPATIMFALGLIIFGVLFSAGNATNASIGVLRFGDHWAVVANALLIVAVQTAIIGVFASLFGIQQGYRRPSRLIRAMLRSSHLQWWVLGGLVLMGCGVAWAFSITLGWILSDFGELKQMRGMLAAAVLVVTGSQVFFSGFLMSIIAGNRSTHFGIVGDARSPGPGRDRDPTKTVTRQRQ